MRYDAPEESCWDWDAHADAHPSCEGCKETLCTFPEGGSCGCGNPAPVIIEGLTFCSSCAEAEAEPVVQKEVA